MSDNQKWSILQGDALKVLGTFAPNTFDAVITDPPYASGGRTQTEKNKSTARKYSSMGENAPPPFDGDAKDQRSWTPLPAAVPRCWRLCRRAIPPPASKSQTPMRSWRGNVFGRNWRAPPEPALCGNSTCYAPLVAFFVEEQTSYYQQVEGFVLPFDAARTTARNSRQKTEEIER